MHPHDERPYAFCPMCGGDLEPRSIKTGEPDRLIRVPQAQGLPEYELRLPRP